MAHLNLAAVPGQLKCSFHHQTSGKTTDDIEHIFSRISHGRNCVQLHLFPRFDAQTAPHDKGRIGYRAYCSPQMGPDPLGPGYWTSPPDKASPVGFIFDGTQSRTGNLQGMSRPQRSLVLVAGSAPGQEALITGFIFRFNEQLVKGRVGFVGHG